MYAYMYVCGYTCAKSLQMEASGQLCGVSFLYFSFYVDSEDQTQVIRFV